MGMLRTLVLLNHKTFCLVNQARSVCFVAVEVNNIMALFLLSVSLWCIATVVGLQFGSSPGCSDWHRNGNRKSKYDVYCRERTLICKNTSWDLTTYYDNGDCKNNYYCDTFDATDSYQPFITSTTFIREAQCLLFKLILKNDCIQSIAKKTFTNFVKLRVINLDNNELSNLDFIEDLNELRQLSVNSNNLTQLHANNFEKLRKLEVLNMTFNKLHSVGNGSFSFYSLQTTGQSNSNSKQMEANIISNLPKLQALNLSSNKLEFIETHAFKGFKELISLDLSVNNLKSVAEETFFDLSRLLNLYLNDNEISAFTKESFVGLNSLQQLFLSNNMITEVPLGCLRNFPYLTTLDLGINYLTGFKIGSFSNLKYLIYLNLSHNKFSAVNEVVLYPLNKLQRLDLDNNNLSFINYTSLLSHLPSLRSISVNDNIWSCKFLTNMLKTFRAAGKDYLFNAPARYTEENVHGIVCHESETSGEISDSNFGKTVPKSKMHSAVLPNISNEITNFKTYLSNIVTNTKENTNAIVQLLQYYNRSKTVNPPLEGNSNFSFAFFFVIILLCIIAVLLILDLYMKYIRRIKSNNEPSKTSSVIELLDTSS